MKKSIITLFCGLTLSVCAADSTDAPLKRLEAHLAAAEIQTDMNLRSYDVAQYLDKKLECVESEVMKDLDPAATKLFHESSTLWRKYRHAQLSFEGDLYRGGSIMPLIHNRTFIRITKERLDALSKLVSK